MNINKATLCGRVTRKPELRALPTGTKVTNFTLATNNIFKKSDGTKVEETDFHTVVAFAKTAEVLAQYVEKGQELFVEGRIKNRSWEKEGVKHYATEIMLDSFQFGAKAKGAENHSQVNEKPDLDTIEYPEEEINLEDIPF